MLPVYTGGHSAYKNFVVENLRFINLPVTALHRKQRIMQEPLGNVLISVRKYQNFVGMITHNSEKS